MRLGKNRSSSANGQWQPSRNERESPLSEALDAITGLVVTAGPVERLAMTTWSFAEAAHHPCSLWIAVEKSSPLHGAIERSRLFTLAILHVRQRQLARCFTGEARPVDSCPDISLYLFDEKYWFVEGARTSNACEVRDSFDFDDRTLFVANIVACHFDSRRTHQRQLLRSDLAPV